MVMLELAPSERARPLPPPTFSAPFSSPTLQWPRKKRQRCSNPIVDHLSIRRRLASPSPDPPPSSSSPSSTAVADSRRGASPSRSPAPPSSDRKRGPIRPRGTRKEDPSSSPAHALAAEASPQERRLDAAEKRKEKEDEEEDARAGSEEGCFERMHLRPRAACGGGANGLRRKKKVEMWISLSRDEIEEDYYSITGSKLPRRPKRRPRTAVHPTVLNRIFPGSWLPNTVTLEMYRVHEPIDQRKQR